MSSWNTTEETDVIVKDLSRTENELHHAESDRNVTEEYDRNN